MAVFVSSLLSFLSLSPGVSSRVVALPLSGVLAHLLSFLASLDLAHLAHLAHFAHVAHVAHVTLPPLPPLPPFTTNVYLTAALWIGLALVASLISLRTGISVALTEIVVGVLAGNFLHIQTTDWINFLAGFGSVLLTFLAGAEIDPASFRRHLKASLVIGTVGFLAPSAAAFTVAFWGVHWHLQAAEIAGIALSTTSVAVVYAVMVETGLNRTEIGKLILAACFVNDLGTVLALGVLFANYNVWLALFVFATAVVLAVLPWATRYVIGHWGGRVSEPEVKFLFLVLFGLGGLAAVAQSEAVLPAYLIGLVIAGTFLRNRVLMDRMRSTAFALLTPFYFLKAGSLVALPVLLTSTGAGLVGLFFLTKMAAKIIGIRPLTRPFGLAPRLGNYTTLLMATGLTFGSISALFGLTHGYINQTQYTVLVTVVILSAVVPTMIAQTFFRPRVEFGEVGPGVVQKPQSPLTAEERAELAELHEVTGAMDE